MKGDTNTLLKDSGLKITPARQIIFGAFLKSKKPLSVKELKSKLKNMDEVTIYRNIEQLASVGLISRVAISNERAYFERVHEHHHHIVCTICGTLEDIHDCIVPTEALVLKKVKGFHKITSHSLEFFGVCKMCNNKK